MKNSYQLLLVLILFLGLTVSPLLYASYTQKTVLANIDKSAHGIKIPTLTSNHQELLATQSTLSGMSNQFDPVMGKTTFVWSGLDQKTPDLSQVQPSARAEHAAQFYLRSLAGISSGKSGVSEAVMASMHHAARGPLVARFRQEIKGIEVFNKEYSVLMDREYNFVAGSGYLASNITANKTLQLLAGFGLVEDAIKVAVSDLSGGNTEVSLTAIKQRGSYKLFKSETVSGLNVIGKARAKRVFYEYRGQLVPAHYVEIRLAEFESLDSNDYSYVVSGGGEVLFRKNLVADSNNFTYRVNASAGGYPSEGPHGDVQPAAALGSDATVLKEMSLVTLAHYNKISTQDPWLAEDATMTSGNNVFAYADVVIPQGFSEGDIVVYTNGAKLFDYPLSSSASANSIDNRRAAVVSMFYMNNFMHDWWYDYGFDEASGNAQVSNYDRGGEEGGELHAQAQDYSGLNNANMSTPADGASPRMQQFLWNSKDTENGVHQGLTITSHAALGLLQSTQVAAFGAAQYSATSGSIVRLIDGDDVNSASSTDGCEAATNGADLVGNIAIIDRGSCAFTLKVLNAQNAGAIGAIVVNNDDDGRAAPMGGFDSFISIPSMGINYLEGRAIYELITAGDTVIAEMFSTYPLKDSSFDNGIMAHEWGHYISNRLVGNANGLINRQGLSLGEGWGDFHSLMFIVKKDDVHIAGNSDWELPYAIGTYVEDFRYAGRRAPYTPNMDINPLMFRHIVCDSIPPRLPATSCESPHDAGEVWASMLWDVYVKLLNMHEFSEAQSRMASYLVAGYSMTPIAPTYTEARDAILAAMYATDPEDYAAALEAFARRGLGVRAVSPGRYDDNNAGAVESTSTELFTFAGASLAINATYDGVESGYCSNDNILDVGETGMVSFTLTNTGSQVLSGVTAQLSVTSGHDVTLENDGLIEFSDIGVFETISSSGLTITLNSAGTGDTLKIKVSFPEQVLNDEIIESSDISIETIVNVDFQSLPLIGSSAIDDMETLASIVNFKQNDLKGTAPETQSLDANNTALFSAFNSNVDLGSQTMALLNNNIESDVAAESAPVEVGYGQDFSVSFWHFFWIEESRDGGVVEISINDSDWVDVQEMGGVFDVGYTGYLNENSTQSLQDRPTFTGINGNFSTVIGNKERISFGQNLNGQTVRLRFRIATDAYYRDFGWFIDNVEFSNIVTPLFSEVIAGDTFACDNSAPKLTITEDLVIDEGNSGSLTVAVTDRNLDDHHTYRWVQTTGSAATLSGADTATLGIIQAPVAADTTLTFEVTVTDGKDSVVSSVDVTVNDIPPPPTPVPPTPQASSGGGGCTVASDGSSDASMPVMLLLVGLLLVRRRYLK